MGFVAGLTGGQESKQKAKYRQHLTHPTTAAGHGIFPPASEWTF